MAKKTAKQWWRERRSEIVEVFDREIYGRVPQKIPPINWETISTSKETNGTVPVITKKLLGHVDNSGYPAVSVDIQLTLSTPANASARSVPQVRSTLPSAPLTPRARNIIFCCAIPHG